MTTTSNRSNSFKVDISYRTNSLSRSSGGLSVKVVYADGSIRIYDKIKNTDAYIYYLLNRTNEDVVSATVVENNTSQLALF